MGGDVQDLTIYLGNMTPRQGPGHHAQYHLQKELEVLGISAKICFDAMHKIIFDSLEDLHLCLLSDILQDMPKGLLDPEYEQWCKNNKIRLYSYNAMV